MKNIGNVYSMNFGERVVMQNKENLFLTLSKMCLYTNKRKQRKITRKYTLRLGVDTFRVCKQFFYRHT